MPKSTSPVESVNEIYSLSNLLVTLNLRPTVCDLRASALSFFLSFLAFAPRATSLGPQQHVSLFSAIIDPGTSRKDRRMAISGGNSFKTRDTLNVGAQAFEIHRLEHLEKQGIAKLATLPFSLRVLLENLLRFEDGRFVHPE